MTTSLQVKPDGWRFQHQGGLANFTLTSSVINKRLGFMAKTSNPGLYRVLPEFGFIEPNGKIDVQVTRSVGTAGTIDELVVQWAEVEQTETDARVISKSPVLAEVCLPLKTARRFRQIYEEFK